MTNVEVGESLSYGFKLFAYLLAVVVLGGGGMGLGAALAGPELSGGVGDSLGSPELAGGLVLGALGLVVWLTGTFGLAYKLLADAVQRGVAPAVQSAPVEPGAAEPAAESAADEPARPVGPSPGEQTARESGPGTAVPGAADVPDRGTGRPSPAADSQPETAEAESAGSDAGDWAEPEAQQDREGAEKPATGSEPSGDGAADDATREERTAEEIAFGDRERRPAPAGGESEPAGATADETGSARGTNRVGSGQEPAADDEGFTESLSEDGSGSAGETPFRSGTTDDEEADDPLFPDGDAGGETGSDPLSEPTGDDR